MFHPTHPLRWALLLGLLAGTSVHAEPLIEVEDAWLRAMPAVSKVNGAYLTIHNRGDQADRLLEARSALTPVVEIHRTEQVDGHYRMRELHAVEIPAGGTVSFSSGDYHLMLKQVRRVPKAGERIPLTLLFERAGAVHISAEVRGPGAQAANTAVLHGAHQQEHQHQH